MLDDDSNGERGTAQRPRRRPAPQQRKALVDWSRDDRGVSYVEYLILLALIGLAMIAGVRLLHGASAEVGHEAAGAVARLEPLRLDARDSQLGAPGAPAERGSTAEQPQSEQADDGDSDSGWGLPGVGMIKLPVDWIAGGVEKAGELAGGAIDAGRSLGSGLVDGAQSTLGRVGRWTRSFAGELAERRDPLLRDLTMMLGGMLLTNFVGPAMVGSGGAISLGVVTIEIGAPLMVAGAVVTVAGVAVTVAGLVLLAKDVGDAARDADSGGDESSSSSSSQRTEPTGPKNGKPTGPRAQPKPNDDAETVRGLNRENESADIFAKNGYRTEQKPNVPGSSKPDFRIEGRIFENKAPSSPSPRNIATTLEESMTKGQADRFVVNLEDSPVSVADLQKQLTDYPIQNLQEVFAIKDGQIIALWP